MSKWYKHKSADGDYYALNPSKKQKLEYVGKGNVEPSPKELLARIEEIQKEYSTEDGYISDAFNSKLIGYNIKDIDAGIELPFGAYTYGSKTYDEPSRLISTFFRKDEYIKMPRITDDLTKDVKHFLASENLYRGINSIYKMGILLYGPPGEGKTSLIRSFVTTELPKESIILSLSSMIPSKAILNALSKLNVLKVFIFEEVTSLALHPDAAEKMLTFLDGEDSVDKSIILATTNYPERLPGNLVERPSRFDKLYKVGSPQEEERRLLLNYYLTRECTQEEIEMTKDMSSATVKEVCLISRRNGISTKQAADKLAAQIKTARANFAENKGKFGL